MTSISSPKDKTENSFNNDDINFNLFFKFVNRNKKNISIFSVIFFIFACLYSLSLKRIWSGEFQIVLNSGKSALTLTGINPSLENLLTRAPNQLQTQVGILKSPSILVPIYEFVINKRYNA